MRFVRRSADMALSLPALLALFVALIGHVAATCPTAPAGAILVASIFGSSIFEMAAAPDVLTAAIRSDAAKNYTSQLWTSAELAYREEQRIGATGAISASLAAFLTNAVACNVKFIVSTSCSTAAVQLYVARNTTGIVKPVLIHAAVCTARQSSQQLGAFAAASASSTLPALLTVSHALAAHAEAVARLVRTRAWPRIGVLLDVDQFDPQLVPAIDRIVGAAAVCVPNVRRSALDALSSAASTVDSSDNVASRLALNFFTSNATVDVLRLYARSLREQNVRIIVIFCGLDLAPRVWAALSAEHMIASGVALVLAESLASADVFSPSVPASVSTYVSSSASLVRIAATEFNSSAVSSSTSLSAATAAARSSAYILVQGAIALCPSSASLTSFAQRQFVASIAPLRAASGSDFGPSAPYLYDAVAAMRSALDAAASRSIAIPISPSDVPSLLGAMVNATSIFGASGLLEFANAPAPIVSALAPSLVSGFASSYAWLDSSLLTGTAAMLNSTLQRLVSGAFLVLNAQGAEFVATGAATGSALDVLFTRSTVWPGSSATPPTGAVLPLVVWGAASASVISSALAALLAIDLVNSYSYSSSPDAVAVFAASSAYVATLTGSSAVTAMATIPVRARAAPALQLCCDLPHFITYLLFCTLFLSLAGLATLYSAASSVWPPA